MLCGITMAPSMPRATRMLAPSTDGITHFGAAAALGQPEERPGALSEALDQSGLGQQFEVARDARLRLAQDVGEVGDGQFGLGQERQHAQARLFARGFQGRVEGIEAECGAGAHQVLLEVVLGPFPTI